jgi:GAF domain-containing protein
LLWEELKGVNWVGFYVAGSVLGLASAAGARAGEGTLPSAGAQPGADVLVLGPFQGKVACVSIPWGRGVCGTAAASGETQRVDDVHAFAGHIACDAASRSEVVVPLRVGDAVVGVLDIDSPHLARFSEEDVAGLEACARVVERAWTYVTSSVIRRRGRFVRAAR